MDIIESDQLLLLAATTTVITLIALLVSVLVFAVRIRKELDALKPSVQTAQSNLTEIVRITDRTFVGLQELSGVGLHFRQIKRDQFRLSEKLKTISSAMDTLERLLQLREETQKWQDEEIKELADASKALQEWSSRMTAVYSDAGHLFESEPIRELIDRYGPQPTSYTVSLAVREMAQAIDDPRVGSN